MDFRRINHLPPYVFAEVDALKATRGKMAAASRQLGITPRMRRYKLGKLGIDCRKFSLEPK